ncbi:hypothetical protein GCM10027612_69860 [Microbispora bryophytorum subsp. camponoti]
MRETITIVGGGLAGLTAAIACAEGGAAVVLHEAHHTLGGRARSAATPYVANDGTHVFYADGGPGAGWTSGDSSGPALCRGRGTWRGRGSAGTGG